MVGAVLVLLLPLVMMVAAAYVLPSVVAPDVPFGVRIPPQKEGSPEAMRARSTYRATVLWAGGAVTLLAVAAALASGISLVLIAAVGVVLAVWLLAYARAHMALKAAKRDQGWYAGLHQAVTAETSLRTSPPVFPWLWAVPSIAVVALNLVVGIVRYPSLPSRLAIHYSLGGRANGFAAKSYLSAFTPVLIEAVLTALLVVAAAAWLRSTASLDPARAEESLEHHRLWTSRMTRGLLVVSACMNLTLLLTSFKVWEIGGALTAIPAASGLPVLVGAAALIVVALRTQQAGASQAAGARRDGELVPRDDDRNWIGGLFYWNPADKALLVPRRFGVGMTLNVGNAWSWVILAGGIGLAVFAASVRHQP